MKCRYGDNCKFGGEVSKEESVKEGNAYYHEECLKEKKLKKEIEQYWIDNMPPATLSVLRKVIKQLLNNKSAEYVLFVLKYINNNKKPINNPFGLINYCNDLRLENEFKRIITNKNFQQIKKNIVENKDNNKVTFTYKPINNNHMNII